MKAKSSKILFFHCLVALFSLSSCSFSTQNTPSVDTESNTTESIESESNTESESIFESESTPDSESESLDESSESESEPPVSESESESESEDIPNEHITLETPKLSLDDSGLVSWSDIENCEYYRYYVNGGEVQTTTSTSIELSSGETLAVIAESSLDYVHSSSWSKPVTYFDIKEDISNITIAFANCELPSVEVLKGSTYSLPNAPIKEFYSFEGWYLDPFFNEKVTSDHIYNKDTIVYANYLEDDWISNASYWIKANDCITSTYMSFETGWKFIPLYLDKEKSTETNKKCFSATVVVENATTLAPAAFLVMDGTKDNAGRTYYKDGQNDFTISADGVYKIYFSVEYAWTLNGNPRNCYIEHIDDIVTNTYTPSNIPLGVLEESTELGLCNLYFLEDGETVSWLSVDNATHYEYVIDNGEIKTTTSNTVILYEGSHITVRAISNESTYLDGKWSTPLYHEIPKTNNSVYVYFYGLDRGSQVIEKGSLINRPSNDPVKPGYEFINWFSDISNKTLFDFSSPINKNTVIYAGFKYIDIVKYELYASNKTTKLGDLVVNDNYSFNEYKITYTTTAATTDVYIKATETNKFYGAYTLSGIGTFNIYFSEDNLWDLGTINERNAYWEMEKDKIYFTNGLSWSKVYIYTWNDSGYYKAWPGTLMEYYKTNSYGQDIYKYSLPSGYSNVIFTNGSGSQTVDINLNDAQYNGNNAFYPTDKNSSGKYLVGSWMEN